MDASAPTARFLQARITHLSNTLIKRLENILEAALPQPPSSSAAAAAAASPTRDAYTATAVQQFHLDVESAALVRAAEEIMVLTRSLKDIWLFGGLDTLDTLDPLDKGVGKVNGDADVERQGMGEGHGARKEDVEAVLKYIVAIAAGRGMSEPEPEQEPEPESEQKPEPEPEPEADAEAKAEPEPEVDVPPEAEVEEVDKEMSGT